MKIHKENTVAVCIDIQEKLFPFIYEYEVLENSVNRLISGFQVLDVPIIVTEQYTKGLGPTWSSIREALKEEYQPIEKMAFSCCKEDNFFKTLKMHNKKNVLLFGIESHVCVLQTAIDLIDKGFIVILVEDCVSSRKLSDKSTAIARMRSEGALITSYESVLFEMLQYSGTNEFRAVSKIVK